MLELIGLGIGGAAGAFGHLKSKEFVARRLRYTSVVERSGLGMGAATGAVTTVALAALPIVTLGPAALVGIGVGTGVAAGIRRARRG